MEIFQVTTKPQMAVIHYEMRLEAMILKEVQLFQRQMTPMKSPLILQFLVQAEGRNWTSLKEV
jgi:hypothetical protein